MPVDAPYKNSPMMQPEVVEPSHAGDEYLNHLLVQVDDPWYVSLRENLHDLFSPPKLPPLKLTSQPVAVKDIWGEYRYGRQASLTSVLVHVAVAALLIIPFRHQIVPVVKNAVLYFNPVDISPYLAQLPPSAKKSGGGGGGGDRDPLPASKGKLPKFSLKTQLTPPTAVIRNQNPKLPEEPTVVVPPEIKLPNVNLANLGDPMGKLGGPLSNGPGSGGGIGTGEGGGVGSGSGGGVGPGQGGGIGGGVFRVGGGVSAPAVVFKVDPEYSEQARKAKYQGTVVLNLVVQRDGTVRDVKVIQPLGLGLDEKAIEAVKQWKFRPGQKNGAAVDVAATVEVTFRLL